MSNRYQPIEGVSVIGFTGKARHGKDTAARVFMRNLEDAERFAFSDGIAAYARSQEYMLTPRDPNVLVRIGVDWRTGRPFATRDMLYGAIDDRRPPVALITGVRFEDEAEMIRDMGGLIVKVIRTQPDGKGVWVSGDRDPKAITETEMDRISPDFTLVAASQGELSMLALDLVRHIKSVVRHAGS